MKPVFVEELSAGTYLILSNVVNKGINLLVIKRGSDIRLVKIPVNVLVVSKDIGPDPILEIKEGGGFKVPIVRSCAFMRETSDIDNYVPSGPQPR